MLIKYWNIKFSIVILYFDILFMWIISVTIKTKYYPTVTLYYVRQHKIKHWFKDLSLIITDYILDSVKNKYDKYIDYKMLDNVNEKEFFKEMGEEEKEKITMPSAKRLRVS